MSNTGHKKERKKKRRRGPTWAVLTSGQLELISGSDYHSPPPLFSGSFVGSDILHLNMNRAAKTEANRCVLERAFVMHTHTHELVFRRPFVSGEEEKQMVTVASFFLRSQAMRRISLYSKPRNDQKLL